jgi:hypothetical protein
MPSPDSKTRARDELVGLIESQLNTLERETFGCVTEAELCEYEDRRDRICHLEMRNPKTLMSPFCH